MEKFLIAGLKTEYDILYDRLKEHSEPYKSDFDGEPNIRIELKEEDYLRRQEKTPRAPLDIIEYVAVGTVFNRELMNHKGIMLHSSCVEKDGYAYLFSADCGTGKSTHTHLWLKNLSGTRIINDDKPALRLEDDVWYAHGTPFSGKHNESINTKVPVRAIVFIERAEKNEVSRLDTAEAIKLIFKQLLTARDREIGFKLLENVDLLLTKVPVFLLKCNMEDEAAITSYNEIERLIKNED
ncbi:MAG: hypothetical protein IKC45_03245 [Clostridia bacterium]|nr:hypothetical protein [Clostridia bacterium]